MSKYACPENETVTSTPSSFFSFSSVDPSHVVLLFRSKYDAPMMMMTDAEDVSVVVGMLRSLLMVLASLHYLLSTL